MTFKKFILFFVLAFFLTTSSTFAASAPQMEKVTITQFGKEKFLLYLPLYIAMEEGLFAKHGVDVKLTFAGNDDQIFAAVIGGSADFGMGDPVFAAISHDKGGPGKVVAMMITRLGLSGYTNNPKVPMITDKAQLDGWRISSFPEPSTTYTMLKEILAQDKKSKIVQIAFGAQLAALEADQVDIALDLEPNVSIAEDKGDRVVLAFEDYTQPQAVTGLQTTEDTIKNKPQMVQHVVDALQDAVTLLHAHPEVAIDVAKKLFPDLKDSVVKTAVYRMLAKNVYPNSVVVSDALWQRTLKTRLDSGELKKPQATDVTVDNSFAEKAMAEEKHARH